MEYPVTRLRRLRRTESMRNLVRETHLEPGALIYPSFSAPAKASAKRSARCPASSICLSMRHSRKPKQPPRSASEACCSSAFPESKDEQASGAWDDNGIVQRGLRTLKQSAAAKKLLLIADVCLCEYTSHGHCGIVKKEGERYEIENDSSVAALEDGSIACQGRRPTSSPPAT